MFKIYCTSELLPDHSLSFRGTYGEWFEKEPFQVRGLHRLESAPQLPCTEPHNGPVSERQKMQRTTTTSKFARREFRK